MVPRPEYFSAPIINFMAQRPSVVLAYGIVFSLTPMPTICKTANCFWAEKVLYQFAGIPTEEPGYGDLAWDSMGTFMARPQTGEPPITVLPIG